jgi:hypothetical protein
MFTAVTGVAGVAAGSRTGDAGLVQVIENFLARIAKVVNGKPAFSA